MKIALNPEQELTTEMIKKIIQANVREISRLRNLEDYYLGKTKITRRYKEDSTAPCNKVVAPYCKYISDTFSGYFGGSPIEYKNGDEVVLDKIKDILKDNHSAEEDSQIIRDMSVFGRAYEMFYFTNGEIKFKRVSPLEMIMITDDTIDENLLYAVRYYTITDYLEDKDYVIVEVYDNSRVTRYKCDELMSTFSLIETYQHSFQEVPFSEVLNNDYGIGDFEQVISLVDAYDSAISDNLDNLDQFADAYMIIEGDCDFSSEEFLKMKEQRGIKVDTGVNVSFLTKDTTNTNMAETLDRLDSDILKFSNCPNLSDENFSGNQSGVAIKFKFGGMEEVCSIKETKMRRFIEHRLKMIENIMTVLGDGFDSTEFQITFTRNIPTNDSEVIDSLSKLVGIVSNKTLLTQVPFVEDVDDEIKQLDKDKEQNAFYSYPTPEDTEEDDEEEGE